MFCLYDTAMNIEFTDFWIMSAAVTYHALRLLYMVDAGPQIIHNVSSPAVWGCYSRLWPTRNWEMYWVANIITIPPYCQHQLKKKVSVRQTLLRQIINFQFSISRLFRQILSNSSPLNLNFYLCSTTGWFFSLVPPLKVLSTEKLIWASLGVSRTIYVNVDSLNLGFPHFNF